MRGDWVNLNFKAFNKQRSGLIVQSLEIPHYAYSSRYKQLDFYVIAALSFVGEIALLNF